MASRAAYTGHEMDDVDWVVVDLAVFGTRPAEMTIGERMEATRRLLGMGFSLNEIADKLRISQQTAIRYTKAIRGIETRWTD